jgi:DNA-binding transcriptional regulator YhcF (GntR family)
VGQEDIMKKLVLLATVLLLVVLIPWASAGDKPDAKMLQEKLDHKIAEMKASGASQSEIDTFTAEFKKKVAAMNEAQFKGNLDAKMIKAEYEKKVAHMKASGASQEDIDAFTADFKKKVVARNNGLASNPPDEKAFMQKVNMKAKEMKAAGASADEINKMVAEAKQKLAEMHAMAEKEGKATITQKIE